MTRFIQTDLFVLTARQKQSAKPLSDTSTEPIASAASAVVECHKEVLLDVDWYAKEPEDLLNCLIAWHDSVQYNPEPARLGTLYYLCRCYLRYDENTRRWLASRFACYYVLEPTYYIRQLADAICQALFWQSYDALLPCLNFGTSNARYHAVIATYHIRQVLPWQCIVPALLDNVSNKILDLDLSFALAWYLLPGDNADRTEFVRHYVPSDASFLQQYHGMLDDLLPNATKHFLALLETANEEVEHPRQRYFE